MRVRRVGVLAGGAVGMMRSAPHPVLCLPFAGAGASFFRLWRRLDVPGVAVEPLQLPGREERLAEAPCTDVGTAVAGLLPAALEATHRRPVALFGHSLGAVLAYELARALVDRCPDRVAHLFVSGSPAPWDGRTERATGCPDEEFVARVERFAGYRHPALGIPELRELLLPALRADVQMHEHYVPSAAGPLPVPITCMRARGDHLVSAAQAGRWREATSARFDAVEVDGGHMYLADDPGLVLGVIARTLGHDPVEAADALAR